MTHRPPIRQLLGPLLLAGALACAGCETLRVGTPKPAPDPEIAEVAGNPATPPGKHAHRISQYVFYCDFDLKTDSPLFRELSDLRDQVYRELHLPPGNSVVQVFLFEDQARYERFMKARYAELPNRRAYFIAQPKAGGGTEELLVYTFWGDHIRTDLRHELTHALLHSVLKDVPLWLDEGLASYFELPPRNDGVNPQHLEQLRRGPFQPDLARLEKLTQVQHMEKPEYREAWAWVHLMLRGSPEAKDVLLGYLQQLRTKANPGPLHVQLQDVFAEVNDALADHLAKVETPRARVSR